jgi:hypothetical protein
VMDDFLLKPGNPLPFLGLAAPGSRSGGTREAGKHGD